MFLNRLLNTNITSSVPKFDGFIIISRRQNSKPLNCLKDCFYLCYRENVLYVPYMIVNTLHQSCCLMFRKFYVFF